MVHVQILLGGRLSPFAVFLVTALLGVGLVTGPGDEDISATGTSEVVPLRIPNWRLTALLSAGGAHEGNAGWYEFRVANMGNAEIWKRYRGPLNKYDVLFSGEIDPKERAAIFRAVRDDINGFRLGAKQQVWDDGWRVSLRLASGERQVEVQLESLDSPRDAGRASSIIVDFINKHVERKERIVEEPK